MISHAESLVIENLPLVAWVMGRMSLWDEPAFDREDMYQEGCIGLMEAAQTYDSDKGKFSPWAVLRIRGHIVDAIRRERGRHESNPRRAGRREQASLSGDTLELARGRADKRVDVEREVIDRVLVEGIVHSPALSEAQRSMLARLLAGMTPAEIAREDGVTDQAISHRMALVRRKLNGALSEAAGVT